MYKSTKLVLNHKCRSKSLVQLTWLSEFELTELKQKKMSRKLLKMNIFLGFEHFLCSNKEAERKLVVPKPQM